MILYKIDQGRGFIALMGVVLVSSISVLIVAGVLIQGAEQSKTTVAVERAFLARGYAQACAEEALERIKALPVFTGTSTLIFTKGDCSSVVINTGGSTRTIDSRGNAGTIVRRVKVLVSALSPQIIVSSWQEVGAF
jgi:hypothetical protein